MTRGFGDSRNATHERTADTKDVEMHGDSTSVGE
jgi:hypothetical protein